MIRRAVWRAFAVSRKDIESVVSSAILSRGPIPQGTHPLNSTYTELQMDDMDQVEAAAGSMYVLNCIADDFPEVQSGKELVDFLHQYLTDLEEKKTEKKPEDDED